jgi:hypothetical protein
MSAKAITGGCQCGAVRYRLDEAPTNPSICHCRMCQKAGGGAFIPLAGLPTQAFVVTRGTVATFVSSEIADRGFCANCGTPLTYGIKNSGRVAITLGSLDEPAQFAPAKQYGIESRLPWLEGALSAPTIRSEEWLAKLNHKDAGSHQHPDRD